MTDRLSVMYTHTLQYYLALRQIKLIDMCRRWVDTENVMASDICQTERTATVLFLLTPRATIATYTTAFSTNTKSYHSYSH